MYYVYEACWTVKKLQDCNITCLAACNNTGFPEWFCMKFHITVFYCNLPTHSSSV